jgi:demethylspheroidene O-methyltransferase
VALELLEQRSHGRYGLGRLGAPLVGNDALSSMILHHTNLYEDLKDPLALLRGVSSRKKFGEVLGLHYRPRGRVKKSIQH